MGSDSAFERLLRSAVAAPKVHPPGTRLGHYEVRGILGEGGFGIVYEAWDLRRSRSVALKDFRQRNVRHESSLAARLRHPNIVSLLDVGEANGSVFVVYERVEGPPLAALPIETRRRHLPALAEGLFRALGYAHDAGVLHLDVSPGNVLWAGRPMLTDFGLGALRESASGAVRGGTPGFVSPELRKGPRADLYALGALLWWATTGVTPREECDEKPEELLLHQRELLDALLDPMPERRPSSAWSALARWKGVERRRVPTVQIARTERPPALGRSPVDVAEALQALEASLATGGLVRVSGPRPSGKTALLQGLATRLRARGVPVFSLTARRGIPCGTFEVAAALRRLLPGNGALECTGTTRSADLGGAQMAFYRA
ncbi:MAG: serine/threonine-protein kinase, partial [Myxococcota bacterium]